MLWLKIGSDIYQDYRKTEKEHKHFQGNPYDEENKASVSSVAENVEIGEITSSSSEWKTGFNGEFLSKYWF